MLGCFPCRRAEIVGIVIGVGYKSYREKDDDKSWRETLVYTSAFGYPIIDEGLAHVRHSVDDGTDTIDCICANRFHAAPPSKSPPKYKRTRSGREIITKAPPQPTESGRGWLWSNQFELGDPVRVMGKIECYPNSNDEGAQYGQLRQLQVQEIGGCAYRLLATRH